MSAGGEGLVTFMGLSFATNDAVLRPREETEILARAALGLLDELGGAEGALRVIDMCCGSGNLACALAHARPAVRVWASDLTDACVALARANVARLDLGARVEVRQGDLFADLRELPAKLEGSVDLVVCNPPYISSGKLASESAHLLDGQPREAFDGGPYGFSIHKRMIQEAPAFLQAHGWLVMEIGLGQEKQIEGLFTRSKLYEDVRTYRDESGAPRVLAARISKKTQAE